MKLSFILLLASFLQASAITFAQKVNVKVVNAPVKQVFYQLTRQTGFNFIADASLTRKLKPITFDMKNADMEEVLRKCFEGINIDIVLNKEFKTVFIREDRSSAQQQSNPVQGKVTDDKGESLAGVSVRVKNTQITTITDADGNYKINVPGKETTLVFSYVGFTVQEKKVENNKTINIILKELSTDLDEVVVTALGIRREEKSLGYSITEIKGEHLTDALSNNWTDALSGKVAGLNLVRSGAGPTGSNKIILRGENNLTGENEALIVVDGVVINNGSGRMAGTGETAYQSADSPVDYGSSLNDINPEDIESVSVLKGPGAAALYGQRGANGAIIITTKSGKPRYKGLGVTFNSTTSIETIRRWPDFQYEYGQAADGQNYYAYGNNTGDGASTRATANAWGAKFDGQMFYQYDPATNNAGTERTPWIAYPNNRKDFFDIGKTFTNNITLDGGTAKTSVRFAITNATNTWIIPNTGYGRNTVALSARQNVTDKLQISTKINYTNKNSDNLPASGYNNQSIMYWNINWVPNGNLDWLKDYWLPGRTGVSQRYPFSSVVDNPYLIAYEMLNKQNRNSITGNIQATYNFTKDLSLMIRTSMDFAYNRLSQQRPKDTEKYRDGMYHTKNTFSQEVNSDFYLKYGKTISKKFETSFGFGGSAMSNNYVRDEVIASSLIYPQIFTFANSKEVPVAKPYRSEYAINSFYGQATLSFNKYLFLDITGRNDWNSVLATRTSVANTSFFYPSVNLSAILSDMFRLPSAISYFKLRGSFAQVGSGRQSPYITSYRYNTATGFPGGLENPSTLANINLKPLFTTSYELGTDIRLFKNRLGIDVALYKSNTSDQILTATVDRSSGVSGAIVNAGEVMNKGIELQMNGTPIAKKRGLNWKINGTFAVNYNEVLALTDSLFALQLQRSPGGRGFVEARVGASMDAIYGLGYQRSPDGQIIYENGYPLLTSEMVYLGNTTPRWKASISNDFKYKRFAVGFLIDGQYGGVAYSLTHAVLAEQGKLKNTLPGRYDGIIGNGVIKNTDGTYRPNDVIADNTVTYYKTHYSRDNVESNLFSTDFIKLREVKIDYTFSAKLNKRLGLQKALIGIYGRDLFSIDKWPAYDPEFGTLNDGSIDKGFEIAQFPTTRTFGLRLVVGI